MKSIHYIIYMALAALSFTACQEEDFGSGAKGGIRISLTEASEVEVSTKSTPTELWDDVKEKFKIKVTGTDYNETFDYTDELIPLEEGTYDVEATCGEDVVLALDAPYFVGKTEDIKVSSGEKNVSIECAVANALVTVKFEELDKSLEEAYVALAINDADPINNMNQHDKSFYFKAGSSITSLILYKDNEGGNNKVDLLDEAKKALGDKFPNTFAAGDHLIITLSSNGKLSLDVSVKVEKSTIEETIPMEWLPKPSVSATGFDSNNSLTFAETETKEAKLDLKLASALQDIKFKFDFQDEQFSLDKEKEYVWSNAEDKQVIESTLGISISDKSVDLTNLLAKLQTNAGTTTTNTIEVDVKANDRWSSEDEEANRTYTITCNKPVFRVDAYPGNIWTKEFTMNALREEQVESGDFAKISGNIKYQYSTNQEQWSDLGSDLRQANLTAGTTYYIRGLYRGEVPSEVTEVKTYEAIDIPNSTLDGGYTTTNPKRNNPLYIFNGGWIDTRNELTCHSAGVNAFYVSKSSTLPVNDNGSTVAHMMVIGWGAGNTCDFGEKRNSVINNVSSGLVCVGDYDANSDVINPKEAHIRPSSLTFTYKASPYNGDEYLVEATLLNITADVETIIGEGRLQSGVSVGNYTTQSLDIAYNESNKELPISHVRVLFKAGTKEDKDHLENDFRDASIWEGYTNAYIIGSQFWLDSFHFNYDK